MKKLIGMFLVAGAAILLVAPAIAADDHNWKFTGGVRVRADYFENYDFLDVDNGGADDSGAFWPFTIRFGAEGDLTEDIHGMIELRNDSVFGGSPTFNEYAFLGGPPLGGNPQSFSSAFSNQDDVNIYQAKIDLKNLWAGLNLTVGRQEFTYGTELLIGDNDFYTGQAYDGVKANWTKEKWALNAFYFKLVENNFNSAPSGASRDTNLFGVTFDFMLDKFGDLGVYYMRHQGLDETFATSLPSAGIDSYGVRWSRLKAADDQWFDWNLEYVMQSGDITGLNISQDADAIEGWIGFNLHGDKLNHRFAVGYLNASGDDPTTTDNEAFFPMFNDAHAWNRLGNLDNLIVSNIEDINASYTLTAGKHTFGVALHELALDQDAGLGEDSLGQAWDLLYNYDMNENYGFQVGVSSMSNGDVIDLVVGTPNDDPMRAWGQFSLRW